MIEKKDCKIVQDLLPNYIEKLTNDETNKYIEEHLNECKQCKNIYDNMKKDFEVGTEKQDDREVKYIKKYSRKMKILKFVLLFIVVLYVSLVGRKAIIMTYTYSKSTQYLQNDNYYVKEYSFEGDHLSIIESYNKGGNYLTKHTIVSEGKENKVLIYEKDNDKLFLSDNGDKKYILNFDTMVGGHVSPYSYFSDGFLTNLQEAFFIRIDSEYCNGKDCYVIKGKSYVRYIDKETGLAVRSIEKNSESNDYVTDCEFKFNVVKDSDIVKPDIAGYEFFDETK